MTDLIDLRTDTVTKPTDEMRDAMRNAEVGDEYYFEDPTVTTLEEIAADKLGKEAALFVASGTMGNAVSAFTQTNPGDVIILETSAHMFRAETGQLGGIAGVQTKLVDGSYGIMSPEAVEAALAVFGDSTAFPRVSLIAIENTHNGAGGTYWTPSQINAVREVADRHGINIHCDGARIFNAAVAQAIDPRELAEGVDTLQFCLTKGLSAPYGSILVGTRDFIRAARRVRQMLGGGMRQAGIMAAAGIIALERMVDRLAEDHANARYLAEELVNMGFEIDLQAVQTNMVFVSATPNGLTVEEWVSGLEAEGIKMNGPSKRLRIVTHYGVTLDDIKYVLKVTSDMLAKAAVA